MEKMIWKTKEPIRSSVFLTKQDTVTLIMGVFGFFLGRVTLFQFINPFASAYLSVFLFSGSRAYFIALLTAVGLFSSFESLYLVKYISAIALMCLINLFLSPRLKTKSLKINAIVASGCVLLSGIVFALLNAGSFYFFMTAILEAVLVGSLPFVFKRSVNILDGSIKRKLLNNEEIISLAILLGAVISGASDVYIGFLSLRDTLAGLVLLVVAYKGGAAFGATAGMLLGLVLFTLGLANINMIGILSFSGLLVGMLKKYGKLFCILGYLACSVLITYYLDKTLLTKGLIFSNLSSCLFFFFMPDTFYFNLDQVTGNVVDNTGEYMEKIKEVTSYKLDNFSYAFKNLAKTLSGLSEKRTSLNQEDISKLVDDVVNSICKNCENKTYCWDKNFYNSYQAVYSMLNACESKPSVSDSDIPIEFKENCINLSLFAEKFVRIFELYKINLSWSNKIADSRELVSEQLMGVSKIIGGLSKELNFQINFKENLEESIINELNKNKIEVDSVIVLENKQGKYEVTVNHKPCNKKRICSKDIIPIINNILGRKMKKEENDCNIKTVLGEAACRISLVEEQKLRVASGVARATKSESSESGDSYSFMHMKNGTCMLALSDGMGSGKKAREESTAVVNLLEDFIESGFDKEMAIKMINSVLVLKNGDESFSTLDICAMDLYTGVAEFIKIGAAATFLLRDNEVSIVKSASLPMGILNSVDLEVSVKKLRDRDIVLMITDGVMDAFNSDNNKEKNMAEFLKTIHSANPQDIADSLLDEASRLVNNVPKDDMTVLAARIWEKV